MHRCFKINMRRMSQNRIILCLALMMVSLFLHGKGDAPMTVVEEHLKGKEGKDRIIALGQLYIGSLEEERSLSEQWVFLNELLKETQRQNDKEEEADARNLRTIWFYNNNFADSIIHYSQNNLDFYKKISNWHRYYDEWSILVNTYIFGGSVKTGLQEAQNMFDDAKNREDEFGMGLAYYVMGSAYYNQNDLDNAEDAYQKSIPLLMKQRPAPEQLSAIFSSMCDLLEQREKYTELNALTGSWKEYLEKFGKEHNITPNNWPLTNYWAYYYIACAQADLGLEKLEDASEKLNEARKHIVSEDEFTFRSWLFFKARLCILQEFYPEALVFNNQRMRLLEDSDEHSEILMTLKQRAIIMTKLGRYQEAAELYSKMYAINDSVNSYESKQQLAEMNTIWEVDELKMKQAREQMRSIIAIASLIVGSLVIFILFRVRSAKRLKKAHENLELAHSQLEDTHQQLLTAYDQLEETTAAKERIESDLRIARDIQMSMVPRTFPERPDVDLYASMTPAKEVGGDLYGFHLIDDKLYFCLGDVSGKGVPASLFMAQATRLFRTLAAQKMMPAEIANHINDALSGEDNERSMFVTMFIGLVDLTTGHLDFCNAGHNPPILIGDGTAEFIEMIPNAPIGLWPEMEYEGEEIADITNHPFFVYSDGLNEAENREQEQFSDERLLEILRTTPFESSEKTIEMLREKVEKHRDGAEPNDDLTMLCVKIIKDNQ